MKNSANSIKTTYETMQDYAKTLESRISFLEKKQSKLPREHIKYVRKGERVQYYLRYPNHTIEYIKTNQKSLIQNLVNAHYTRLVLAKLKKNYKAAKLFLTFHSKKEERDIAESLPLQMQILNNSLFPCRAATIEKWQAEPYQRNPYMLESLMHTSNRGDKLRSKSEVMIADRIENRKIPFKPEFPIYLKTIGKTVYPDFTLLNTETLEEIIWEHFGMMGDPEYAKNACHKIQIYYDNGFELGRNFVATFEAEGAPLTTTQIDHCLNQIFGSRQEK